jgi:hypothetical protein
MHRFPSEGMETEANRLAGALLVPRTDIHDELIARHIDSAPGATQADLEGRDAIAAVTEPKRSQAGHLWRQCNYFRYKMREPAELDFPQQRPAGPTPRHLIC